MKWLPACGCWLGTAAVLAQAQPPSSDELSVQATDPTASLMSFQFYEEVTPGHHGNDDSSNQLVFRAAIPFEMFGWPNVEVDDDFHERAGTPKVTLRAGFALLVPSL